MCSSSKCPSKHVVPHIFFRQNSIKKILGGDLGTMVWNIISFCFQKRTLRQKKKHFFTLSSIKWIMSHLLKAQACKIDTCCNFNSESLDINPFELVSTLSV